MLYRFEDIEKSYGPHDILKGVTWQHNPGEKVALVGLEAAVREMIHLMRNPRRLPSVSRS